MPPGFPSYPFQSGRNRPTTSMTVGPDGRPTISVGSTPQQELERQDQIARNRADQTRMQEQTAIQNQLEQQRMRLQAERNAMDKARQLTSNSNNPLDVESGGGGSVLSVSNLPSGGSGGSGGSRSPGGSGGGGGIDPSILRLIESFRPAPVPREPTPTLPPRTAPPIPASISEGPTSAFSRAKDVSGRVGNKALEALRNQMTSRGMSDSGQETLGEANILGNVANFQSQAEFDAAQADALRQWEAQQLAFKGALGERGDDVGFLSNIFGGGVNQRGQDIAAQEALIRLLPSLIGQLY